MHINLLVLCVKRCGSAACLWTGIITVVLLCLSKEQLIFAWGCLGRYSLLYLCGLKSNQF